MKLFGTAYAHCDLPCGVYDPAQAKIEAESVKMILEKMQDMSGNDRTRAVLVKEERSELVKHHLMVLWADYFKPEHLEQFPTLHDTFWKAIKQASACKHHSDVKDGETLVSMVDDISTMFWETKKA